MKVGALIKALGDYHSDTPVQFMAGTEMDEMELMEVSDGPIFSPSINSVLIELEGLDHREED